jgi:hypothetical protein
MPITLSEREKGLLIALGAVLLLLAGLWGMRVLGGYQRDLVAKLEADQETLTQLRVLSADVERPGGQGTGGRSLAATLEDLLSRTGLRDRIQLNPVTQASGGRVQSMEIKAEQLTLDEMVRLVYTMEGPDVPLLIEQFDIGPSFRDKDLLRVTIRVLGQG